MRYLVLKLLRDIRIPLIVVCLLLALFQVLWARITTRITGDLVPAFTQDMSLEKIKKEIFAGPGKLVETIMGGEAIHDVDGFAEVRVAGVIIGITVRPGTTTGRNAEFPHYAFFVEPKDFLPMVAWLRQKGVITSEPWTRDGVKGLVYFRDPAGNLFEMYCPKLPEAASFVRGKKQGGNYEIDFAALNYQWQG